MTLWAADERWTAEDVHCLLMNPLPVGWSPAARDAWVQAFMVAVEERGLERCLHDLLSELGPCVTI
jgi:hypothetical protein